jgi:hypothetical protein
MSNENKDSLLATSELVDTAIENLSDEKNEEVEITLPKVNKSSRCDIKKIDIYLKNLELIHEETDIDKIKTAIELCTYAHKGNSDICKELFYKYIKECDYKFLIPIYNNLYTDRIFDDLEMITIHITEEEKKRLIAEYKTYVNKKKEEMKSNTGIVENRFYKGEIIGAQDKEGKWWMAQILEFWYYNKNYMYYVSFIGWGEDFDEFITSRHRIRKYDSRRHRMYRNPDEYKKLR